MSRQLSLFGVDDAPATVRTPPGTHVLFFAIFPPADRAEAMAAQWGRLRKERGLSGGPIKADRLHATLLPLGQYVELPQDIVSSARAAAATVVVPPFDIHFDKLMTFRSSKDRRQPVVLVPEGEIAGLTTLRHTLNAALVRAGLLRGAARSYAPHVTLAYSPTAIDGQVIEAVRPSVRWRVEEFVLVDSLQQLSLYTVLGRWRLTADTPAGDSGRACG